MAKKAKMIKATGTAFLNSMQTPETRNSVPYNKSIELKPKSSPEKLNKFEKCTN